MICDRSEVLTEMIDICYWTSVRPVLAKDWSSYFWFLQFPKKERYQYSIYETNNLVQVQLIS